MIGVWRDTTESDNLKFGRQRPILASWTHDDDGQVSIVGAPPSYEVLVAFAGTYFEVSTGSELSAARIAAESARSLISELNETLDRQEDCPDVEAARERLERWHNDWT